MRIGHTIVALNLPSRSMLRAVTALSWCPLPSHPDTVRVSGKSAGGANRVAIIQVGVGVGGVSRSVTGWGRGGGGRTGDDIKLWLAQFDGTTCPPHPLLLVLLWHCSPPKFRYHCVFVLHAVLNDTEWGSGLILTYDVKHMSSTLLVYPVFMYIVWSGLMFCVLSNEFTLLCIATQVVCVLLSCLICAFIIINIFICCFGFSKALCICLLSSSLSFYSNTNR